MCSMRCSGCFAVLLAVASASHAFAQAPTSRVVPFTGVATTIAPSSPGQTLVLQVWDPAILIGPLFTETQTLDVDANGNISFFLGAATPDGLSPLLFPSGSSRYLDVVDLTNTSVLPAPPGRLPFNA